MWWCKFISHSQVSISLGFNFLIVVLFPSYSQLWTDGKLSQGFPKSLGRHFLIFLLRIGPHFEVLGFMQRSDSSSLTHMGQDYILSPMWILKSLSPIIKAYNFVQNLASAFVYTLAFSLLLISDTQGFSFISFEFGFGYIFIHMGVCYISMCLRWQGNPSILAQPPYYWMLQHHRLSSPYCFQYDRLKMVKGVSKY